MYDYTIHESEPADGMRRDGSPGHCAIAQRRLRKAIEMHENFGETFALWQQHTWKATGYCGWMPLPMIHDASRGIRWTRAQG